MDSPLFSVAELFYIALYGIFMPRINVINCLNHDETQIHDRNSRIYTINKTINYLQLRGVLDEN